MKPNRQNGTNGLLLGTVLLIASSTARADIGPPIKISMPPETPPAWSGEEYQGVFTVDVRQAGTLSDFEIHGRGWTILDIDVPSDPVQAERGVFRIPFRAVPNDAEQLITLTLRYDGRKVTRSLRIGPAAFARRGTDGPSIQVSPIGRPANAPPLGVGEEKAKPVGSISGDLILRFRGRIVYDRPTAMTGNTCFGPIGTPTSTTEEGVHGISVEVMNQNDVIDTIIRSMFTDCNGYFDTGFFVWSNCDPICDTPDIYLRWELDTDIVNVQDPSDITEPDYSWSNVADVITDFTGSDHDFGTLKAIDATVQPALHIHNSITRAHLFIQSRVGITVPELDVLWPDSSNASYSSFFQEIKIGAPRQWNEGTHVHEYGHHFLDNFAVNVAPDYCNDDTPFCDDASGVSGCYSTPTGSCGHCTWCQETDHDAWNEGWPNWLGDVVTRSLAIDYQFSDGTPWTAMCPRSQESTLNCCQDGMPANALLTEGFVGALLRDIEDDTQDDHTRCSSKAYDPAGLPCTDRSDCALGQSCIGDGIQDSLCLGVQAIFDTVTADPEPTTVTEFLSRLLTLFPEVEDRLWPTAFNVDPSYVIGMGFGVDAEPPEFVTSLDSPTHPLDIGGTMPCIVIEWTPAPDDVSGSCAYSWEMGTDAALSPDMTVDSVDLFGCLPSVTISPAYMGDYFFSLRAMDCAGNWSSQIATFGPFTITECNDNGILDVCEITDGTCSALSVAVPCYLDVPPPPTFCSSVPGCNTGQDCNTNIVPDDCDIASGFSQDCNFDDTPDECQNMVHWTGDVNSAWDDGGNWDLGTPVPGELVCINVPGDATVVHATGTTDLTELACHENLSILGGMAPFSSVTTADPSFILGQLTFGGTNAILTNNGGLDIDGLFDWTGGGTLTGAGTTNANGGMIISGGGVVTLSSHLLELGNFSGATSTGRMDLSGNALFRILTGSTYDDTGGNIFFGSSGSYFNNRGTFIKSVDAGVGTIDVFTDNSGLIHVQAGTLSLSGGSSSIGDFLGDQGTTLQFKGGGHELLVGSSIVADNVSFERGTSGTNNVRGTYNVTTATTQGGPLLTFTDTANIVSYGSSFFIPRGTVNFDAVIGGPINFDTLSIGSNFSGTANFSTGDPVHVNTLTIGPGTISGPSTVTVSGLTTWKPAGHFSDPGTINANGGLLVEAGSGEKSLDDRVFNNAGTATFLGAFVMTYSAVFNNLSTGVMDIQVDGTIIAGVTRPINNAGTLVKSAGIGTSTITGTTTNTGTVDIQIGELAFYGQQGGGGYFQTAGETILNGGDLRMGGSPTAPPVQIDGGSVCGTGLITGNVNNTLGRFQPGLSIGVIEIVGNYVQGVDATLELEIRGPVQGDDYDLLAVSGDAVLAGRLEIVFINGFEPVLGDVFEVLKAATIAGEFDDVSVTSLPANLNLDVIYGAGAVTLETVGPPGDLTADGQVDLDDSALLTGCMGGPNVTTPPPGCDAEDFGNADLDGDGDVDMEDIALLTIYFSL